MTGDFPLIQETLTVKGSASMTEEEAEAFCEEWDRFRWQITDFIRTYMKEISHKVTVEMREDD